jgi:hypothetical protein
VDVCSASKRKIQKSLLSSAGKWLVVNHIALPVYYQYMAGADFGLDNLLDLAKKKKKKEIGS